MSCSMLTAGTVRCWRSSDSVGCCLVIVRHAVGQTSMQASHSMHFGALNWVWISQLRQRETSVATSYAEKQSSTSIFKSRNRLARSSCRITCRPDASKPLS